MSKMFYMETEEGRVIRTDSPQYWGEAKRLPEKEGKARLREQCAVTLRKYFKPGDTAYTICKYVSSNGMSRHISVFGATIEARKDFQGKRAAQCVPVDLSATVAELLGYKLAKDGGLLVGGRGMDMGFHVVYSMSRAMFPNGTDKPHSRRNGQPDKDGGYAINHRWL